MTVAVLVGRVVLAGVFAAAAWGKLTDRAGTQQAARDFGVPVAAAPAVAFVVPVAELTVAVLLILGGSAAVIGALGAVVLLAVFAVAIAISLTRGRRPDCHCFGRVRAETVSPRTLLRNGALMAIAVFVLAFG